MTARIKQGDAVWAGDVLDVNATHATVAIRHGSRCLQGSVPLDQIVSAWWPTNSQNPARP